MNRFANLSISNNDRQLAWRLMSKENRPLGVTKNDQKSKPLHKWQSDIVIWCVYAKLTLAAELKVVLEPEFHSPADNRPQIRDVAMLLCAQAAQHKNKWLHAPASGRTSTAQLHFENRSWLFPAPWTKAYYSNQFTCLLWQRFAFFWELKLFNTICTSHSAQASTRS